MNLDEKKILKILKSFKKKKISLNSKIFNYFDSMDLVKLLIILEKKKYFIDFRNLSKNIKVVDLLKRIKKKIINLINIFFISKRTS